MLAEEIISDIQKFFEKNTELLFNERDFQMRLALHFMNSNNHYDDVDLEYHIPVGFNQKFDKDYASWKTEKPSIDLVIRKGKEYVPIELKYKLKAVKGSISRFGVDNKKSIEIIPNQSAQNLGRYAFWKDVKRIELVKKHFDTVNCGFAVFLTNDESYLSAKPGSDYYPFRMNSESIITGHLDWLEKKDKYPAIDLNGKYTIEWSGPVFMHALMPKAYYTIVTI
ncbi:MAG: hypothetical protein K5651_03315 [Bacteroidales bacterium]|nr:hypothetical protein [Bacteroidales bacterium]